MEKSRLESSHLSGHLAPEMTGEFYRIALDSISTIIIFTLDRSLIVTYANKAAVDFIKSLNFPGEVVGRHIAEVFPPLKPETLERYAKILRLGEYDEEEINYTLSNRKLVGEVKRFPLRSGGDIIGILISLNDITERRKAEDALKESLIRFDQVSRLAGEWLWEVDENGAIVYSSPSIEKNLGFKTEEIIGKKLIDFFCAETRDESAKFSDGLFRRREQFRGFIVEVASRDGNNFSIELSGEPIFKGDSFTGYRGVALDVTDRLNYEASLAKFKLAVDNASDHIMITDENGVIIYANKAATEITGYSLKEIIGSKPSIWGGQMPAEFYLNMWKVIKEEKKVFIGEVFNRRKNGAQYVVELRISPVLDSKGKVNFFVGIERDITKEKEVDRAKTEFVSLASHQLRTPLSIINWYVSELLGGDEALSPRVREYADEIRRGNSRMIDLVNSLLDVSRIDTGTFLVSPEPTMPCKLIEDVAADFKKQSEDKSVSISLDCGKDVPIINLDVRLMRMILQNLISNAVKYTQRGDLIVVSAKIDGDYLLIAVKDTGIGIPADEKSGVFNKFFRAGNAKKIDPDGNGLGLYLVKSILNETGGEIWFESVEGVETTFFIRIPGSGMVAKGKAE